MELSMPSENYSILSLGDGTCLYKSIRTTELRTKRDKLWVRGVQRGVRMQVDEIYQNDKDVC
jgi:hypothetical protein